MKKDKHQCIYFKVNKIAYLHEKMCKDCGKPYTIYTWEEYKIKLHYYDYWKEYWNNITNK